MTQVEKNGVISAIVSYTLWGLLPIYWKLLTHVSSEIILAERIIWSFVFMVLVIILTKRVKAFSFDWKELIKSPRKFSIMFLTSLFITINWGVYIWAVNSNHIVESSLGYYINPLVSVVFAVIFLKERLDKMQIFAVVLAVTGVLLLTFQYGKFPWIAILLASSFAIYGVLKKLTPLEVTTGITMEMIMIVPFALIFLIFFAERPIYDETYNLTTTAMLMVAGPLTAVPLLLFSKGAQHIPLTLLGFLQYIAPTLQMSLGVFVYGETITADQFFAYCFIWAALVVFSGSNFIKIKKASKLKKVESL